MTTVVPPPPPPIPVPAAGPAATLVIPNPPEALIQLPAGSVIDAQMLAALAKGKAQIQTAFGKIDIRTTYPLPENAKLEIQLLRLAPQVLLAIKAVNGNPLGVNTGPGGSLIAAAPGSQAGGATGPAAAGTAASSATMVQGTGAGANVTGTSATAPQQGVSTTITLDIGSVVKATLLRSFGSTGTGGAAQSAPTSASSVEPLTPQTGGSIGNSAGAQPSGSILGQADTQQAAPGSASAGQGSSGAAGTGSVPRQLPTGTQFELRMLASSSPTAGSGGTSRPDSHNIGGGHTALNGTVVASTPSGQPIIFTSMGMIGLDTKSPLEPGTNMRLEIVSTSVKSLGALIAESTIGGLYQSREWPNFETALDQISQSAPNVSQQVVNNAVPQANSQLTTNMLFFMSALKGGDVRSWIGPDASNILDQTNPELLTRLSEEFSQLGRVFTENQPNDWRTALVPFFTGTSFEQVQMHMRGQNDMDGPEGDEETSRFIIDVQLSQLGRVQLDGLVKSKGKKFDLIVRTDGPLPAVMRKDINRIFTDFTEVTGVNGGIVFQADKKFAEIELPRLDDSDPGGVVV